jgi:hypothetical protein
VSGTPPVAQSVLASSGPEVEDSDDALFTRHTFFVFFGGDEVSEALAVVFLISVFLSPLALLIGFDLLGWWFLLNALSFSQCFIIIVTRLSTLGLVEATFSFLYLGRGFLHPLASSFCTR